MLEGIQLHPALNSRLARASFLIITILRCIFFCIIIFALDQLTELGTSAGSLCLVALAGVLFASLIAFSSVRWFGLLVFLTLTYLSYQVLFFALEFLPHQNPFIVYSLLQHVNLQFLTFVLTSLTTWVFWRLQSSISFEILALSSACIYLLSGHRNFHFDTPVVINDLAWILGVQHLTMLIILGAGVLVFTLGYLLVATLPARPVAHTDGFKSQAHQFQSNLAARFIGLVSILVLVFLVSRQVFSHYNFIAESRTSNGVGETTQAGLSPLGFHSALGSTNQPSALVRLEGDYSSNPFTPMLYMRESALSEFNGHEMVLADPHFDPDITRTRPEEGFVGKEDVELNSRTPLVQSFYLLTDHDNAFAVDYPLSLTRLKNPNPGRFKATYKAYSMAPAFSLNQLLGHEVGDPRWSDDLRKHYTATHADPRYKELALKLTEGLTDPIEKASTLVAYLSKNAIYTLTPNHDVPDDQDQVAPFLFGDLRGYCVHFAHATVYMARALGIPARIGTGYLTDLSQAKDGHILLRMSDRHAWAEIYVQGFGWIPFDTQPQHVESHAESTVDMKLLEELMGLIGPGEEILPKEVAKDEQGLKTAPKYFIPDASDVLLPFAFVLLLLIFCKLYLRYGWLLPGTQEARLKRAYLASLSSLYDLGYRRKRGETRNEFQERLNSELNTQTLSATQELAVINYSRSRVRANLKERLQKDTESLKAIALHKKLLAALNPASALRHLFLRRW